MLGLALAVATLLGSCGRPDAAAEPSPTSTATATATSVPSADPTDDVSPSPVPAAATQQSADSSPGAALTVVDVRTGRHEGFDRVVFELVGAGAPGWIAAYVSQA